MTASANHQGEQEHTAQPAPSNTQTIPPPGGILPTSPSNTVEEAEDRQLVEGLAKAIYMTHRRELAPIWENASAGVREWVRAQARSGVAYLKSRGG